MRCLFWFLPAVVIPLTFQIMSSGQPFSTITVDTQEKPLPSSLTLLPLLTPVAPIVSAFHPPISAKKQPQKVITQKHPPTAKPESSKNKANTRPYTAPAIEIRVKVAQDINNIAIAQARSQSFASSTTANVLDANGQTIESLLPNQSFQVGASNSNILFENWQIPSAIWIEPKEGGAVFVGDRWYRGKLLVVGQGDNQHKKAITYSN